MGGWLEGRKKDGFVRGSRRGWGVKYARGGVGKWRTEGREGWKMRNCKSIIQMPFHSLREHPVHEVQFLAPVLHSAEKKTRRIFLGVETRAENWTGCSSRLAVPYGVQITRKMRTNIPTHLFSRFVLVFLSNRKRCKTQLKVWFSRKNMLDMNLLWDILVCILIRPTGPPKYYKRRKNIQRTWITYFRLAKFN